MSDIAVGSVCLYSPDHCHAAEVHPQTGRLFHFRHLSHGARNLGDGQGPVHHQAGDRVKLHADHGAVIALQHVGGDPAKGIRGELRTHDGHPVAIEGPTCYWQATVAKVNEDGTLDLVIQHPFGYITLEYPDRQYHPNAPGIKHDAKKGPHTWHLPGE